LIATAFDPNDTFYASCSPTLSGQKVRDTSMSAAAPAQITTPPNRAKLKAQPLAEQDFQALLSMAEGTAQQLGVKYTDTVNTSALKLARLAASARKVPAQRAATLQKIQDMAFEMRGEGASFGFDVVSHVADSLYKVIDDLPDQSNKLGLKIIEMHALALNALLAGGIRASDEDEIARQIIAALGAARKKAAA